MHRPASWAGGLSCALPRLRRLNPEEKIFQRNQCGVVLLMR
jgi:hypothetical protein